MCVIESGSKDPDWILSAQDLIDYVLDALSEDVARHGKMNEIKFDKFNCYGLEPETSLDFVKYFGIRYEIDYPFKGSKIVIPIVRDDNVIFLKP